MPPPVIEDEPKRTRTLRSDIIFTIGLLILLALAWQARDVLLLIFVSALFAVVLNPAIEGVRSIHIGHWWPSRGTAIVIIIMIAFVGFGSFLLFAVPPMYHDLQTAAANLPIRLQEFSNVLHKLPFLQKVDLTRLADYMSSGGSDSPFELVRAVGGAMFALFSWMILTAYFVLDGQRAFYWFLSFFAEPQRGRLRSTMLRADKRIRHWLVGQGLMMLILGVTAGVTFWMMHVRYSLFLGVMAGLLNIVPFAGPFTSFMLSSTVAALDSGTKFMGVVAFYFLYQQFENAYLYPKVMRYSVDLPPLAVIVALSIGAALAGVVGALIAVPCAAVVGVLLDEYFVRFHTPGTAPREEPERHETVAGG
jgi:predicted PurR-regulated permease PerM